MKRTVFLFLISGLLCSCVYLRFETPQPTGHRELQKFPSEFTGHYRDSSGFALHVKEKSLSFSFEQKDITMALSSDSVVLKKYKGFYVLSFREDNWPDFKGWELFLLKFSKNSLDFYHSDITNENNKVIPKLEAILGTDALKAKKDSETDGDEYYLINPTKKEFKAMLNQNVFSLIETFKKVEKLPNE